MKTVEQLQQFGARDPLLNEEHDEHRRHKRERKDDCRREYHVAVHWRAVKLRERLVDRVVYQADRESVRVARRTGARQVRERTQTRIAQSVQVRHRRRPACYCTIISSMKF